MSSSHSAAIYPLCTIEWVELESLDWDAGTGQPDCIEQIDHLLDRTITIQSCLLHGGKVLVPQTEKGDHSVIIIHEKIKNYIQIFLSLRPRIKSEASYINSNNNENFVIAHNSDK
jgi:hypothetical protein